jgi:hypothetical protein
VCAKRALVHSNNSACSTRIQRAVRPMAHADGRRPLLCVTWQVFGPSVFFSAAPETENKEVKKLQTLKKKKFKNISFEDKNL